ncbi:MAG: ATP-binding protein [Deltaproteobacteria bacterium]|nr:ATP-binding protein [Deltaproteobacteria bacterium]
MSKLYKRSIINILIARLEEPLRFIQVLSGPRQVGKTTLAEQAQKELSIPSHYASADQTTLQGPTWIEEQWEMGRLKVKASKEAVLFLDEVHKIDNWSEVVKRLWDEDRHQNISLKVVLLGSSPLLLQTGLTESLAGRFEIIPVKHWSYVEMKEAYDWSLEQYVFFGGYPGAAELIHDEDRWSHYILNSLIETTISRDILLLKRVDKPALLRRLFQLGCDYSSQILSYQKMLGQLQEEGNTTTLAHYLDLMGGCGLVSGLPKFSGSRQRQRGSSPKLQVWNNALISAQSPLLFEEAQRDKERWGRLVESAVGGHLLNEVRGTKTELFYWREKNREVDFVLKKGAKITAIEIKSGRKRESFPGMEMFSTLFHPQKKIAIGTGGIPLEDFFRKPIRDWIE